MFPSFENWTHQELETHQAWIKWMLLWGGLGWGIVLVLFLTWWSEYRNRLDTAIALLKAQQPPARVFRLGQPGASFIGGPTQDVSIIYADDDDSKNAAAQLEGELSGTGWKTTVKKSSVALDPGIVIEAREPAPQSNEYQGAAADRIITILTAQRVKAVKRFGELPADTLRILVGPNVSFPEPGEALKSH